MNLSFLVKLSCLMLLFAACNTTKQSSNNTIMWISGEKARCQAGVGELDCLQVYRGENVDDAKWEYFYANIVGFDFEQGFLQKIEVKEEQIPMEQVLADASSIRYELVKVLEKREDKSAQLTGTYHLTSLRGESFSTTEKIPTITLDLSEKQVSGTDGCNNYTGRIKQLSPTKMKFSVLASTKMMCRGVEYTEPFNQAMSQVAMYDLDGKNLILKDETGKELLGFTQKSTAELYSGLHDIWNVERIKGEEVQRGQARPRLEINLTEMMIMGNDGCNNYRGEIKKVDDNTFTVGNLAGTKKLCPNMEIADSFNQALQQVQKYQRKGLNLMLLDEQGQEVLTFLKGD